MQRGACAVPSACPSSWHLPLSLWGGGVHGAAGKAREQSLGSQEVTASRWLEAGFPTMPDAVHKPPNLTQRPQALQNDCNFCVGANGESTFFDDTRQPCSEITHVAGVRPLGTPQKTQEAPAIAILPLKLTHTTHCLPACCACKPDVADGRLCAGDCLAHCVANTEMLSVSHKIRIPSFCRKIRAVVTNGNTVNRDSPQGKTPCRVGAGLSDSTSHLHLPGAAWLISSV